jgi:repressor LexA
MRTKNPELMNRIIEVIDIEYSKSNRVPTMDEIANILSISKGSVSNYISAMSKKGLVKNNGGSRGIITKNMMKLKTSVEQLPVVGSIACGTPFFAEENIESYLTVSKDFLGNGSHFVLRASGDSMINAGIHDGDLVIVRQQETAEEGQIIVALIDDEATLKRYYLDKSKKLIRLHPENKSLEDMFYKNVAIQGVAVKVIKDLY